MSPAGDWPPYGGHWPTLAVCPHPPHPPGIGLRDYFAGQALIGLAQDYIPDRVIAAPSPYAGRTEADVIADRAYHIADRMLEARDPSRQASV